MRTFLIIWFGQVISLLGSAMTRFALLIWAYEHTHQATTIALLGFFAFGPAVLFSPLAGSIVDRYSRRLIMGLADLGAGLMTVVMLALYVTGNLQVWHLFVAETVAGICETFQIPAFTAATTLIVPQGQYARASGMRSLASSGGRVIAPFMAGVLITFIDIGGVLLIDTATFLFAVGLLLVIRIPQPAQTEHGRAARGNLWHETRYGFRFIFDRSGLAGLLLFFMLANFFSAITYFGTLPVMVLGRAGGDKLAWAAVQSALGVGGAVGGLLVSLWGGPKRRIHGVLAGAAFSFMFGDLLFALGPSLPFWVVAAFCGELTVPLIISGDRAIWQAKVPSDVQGRVFGASSLLREGVFALGFLAAGPLADGLMEPAMQPGGALAGIFGSIVGTGPGAGIAATFIFTGIIGITVSLGSYLMRPVRQIEDELPDMGTAPQTGG